MNHEATLLKRPEDLIYLTEAHYSTLLFYLRIAHDLHSVSKNAAVSCATGPKPPTNICALIARFIVPQKVGTSPLAISRGGKRRQ
jgi:hypothetical protein